MNILGLISQLIDIKTLRLTGYVPKIQKLDITFTIFVFGKHHQYRDFLHFKEN